MHFWTVYFIPAILSSLIVGLIFNALFGGRHGVIDSMLASVGLENLSLPWLGERWPAVFVDQSCRNLEKPGNRFGHHTGGLQSVPDPYLEAAKVDGATGWQLFRNITLPLIMPTVNVKHSV